jgi:uncharacterized membrane protein
MMLCLLVLTICEASAGWNCLFHWLLACEMYRTGFAACCAIYVKSLCTVACELVLAAVGIVTVQSVFSIAGVSDMMVRVDFFLIFNIYLFFVNHVLLRDFCTQN